MCKQRKPFQKFVSWFQKNEHPKILDSGVAIVSPPGHGRFSGPNQMNYIGSTKRPNTELTIFIKTKSCNRKINGWGNEKVVFSPDWINEAKDLLDPKIQELINLDKLEIAAQSHRFNNIEDDISIEPVNTNESYCLLDDYIVADYSLFVFTLFEPSEWTQEKDISKCPDVTTLFKGELLDSYNRYKELSRLNRNRLWLIFSFLFLSFFFVSLSFSI